MLTSRSTQAVYDIGSGSGDRVGRTEIESAPIVVRDARAEDIVAFYNKPSQGTIRALVAEIDGEVVGIIGIVRERQWGKYFSEFKPALQPHLKSITIMRAIKRSLKFCDEYRGPVLAIATDVESCRIMNRLGFTHLRGECYAWLG